MSGSAKGGNDTFVGVLNSTNTFYGDAGIEMIGNSVGGSDHFTGGTSSTNTAYGDTLNMSGRAVGGNDVLTGGDDASGLLAGSFNDILVGDAKLMADQSRGGNDTIVSGTGNDDMWGDAQLIIGKAQGGNDSFVFAAGNGHDKIEDFGQTVGSQNGKDHIDVSGLGIGDFTQLTVSAFDEATHESTITFSPGNDVIVHSQHALTAQDFIFVV
jgi:Ca2+-binding RTX toxin-like protein